MRRVLLAIVMLGCPGTPTGTRCSQHADCRSLPEGYCARAELCTRVCETAACPEGYRCSAEGRRQVCLPSCEADSNCYEGFVCGDANGGEGKVCRLREPFKELPVKN